MTSISKAAELSASLSKDKIASLLSLLLGVAFLALIGFSHIEVVHNAAHDTRHSAAFPCH